MKILNTDQSLVSDFLPGGTVIVKPFLLFFLDDTSGSRRAVPVWMQRFVNPVSLDQIIHCAASEDAPLENQTLDTWALLPEQITGNVAERQVSMVGARWRLRHGGLPDGDSEPELILANTPSGIVAGLVTPTKSSCEQVVAFSDHFRKRETAS